MILGSPSGLASVLLGCVLLAGCTSSSDPSAAELAMLASGPQGPTLPEALLLPEPYDEVLVEIDYVRGREPRQATLDTATRAFLEVAGKRRVTFLGPDEIVGHEPRDGETWEFEEIMATERAARSADVPEDAFGVGRTAYIHVLYLDGVGETSSGQALALQIDNVLAIWPDWKRERAFPGLDVLAPPPLDHSLAHELGHAFGLVNCGIPMVNARESPDSRCHSVNERSVMWVGRGSDIDVDEYQIDLDPSDWYADDDLADIRAFQRAHS